MTEEKSIFHRSYDAFWSLVLAGLFSLISFLVFLSFQTFDAAFQAKEMNFYLVEWSVFVPLGFLLVFGMEKLRSIWSQAPGAFYPCAIFSNFIFVLYLLYRFDEGYVSGWVLLLSSLFLQAVVLLTTWWIENRKDKLSPSMETSLWVLMSVFFAYFVFTHALGSVADLQTDPVFYTVSCSFLVLFLCWMFSFALKKDVFFSRRKESLLCLLVLGFIVLMVLEPGLQFNRNHYTFYLGPLADLQGGKSLLVNINSQYGVLVFYFLSFFFKVLPLGFKSLCLVLTFLFIVQYFLFYWITRELFSSKVYSFFCLVVLLLINYFATLGRMTEFPSVGPLRFGFIYLLLVMIILRNRYPRYREWFYGLESIVLAVAFFWSFEVAVYTLVPYLGFLFYECLEHDRKGFRFNMVDCVRRAVFLAVPLLVLMVLIYADVRYRTHEWPHWSYYFDYIFMYKDGFSMISVPFFGAWWLIVGMLFLSLFIVLGSLFSFSRLKELPHFNAMVLLTFFGIFQFFYFLGRGHPNNLFHISMPSILLGAYWLYWLRQAGPSSIPAHVKKTVLVLTGLALGLYLPGLIPTVHQKLAENFQNLQSFRGNVMDAVTNKPEHAQLVTAAEGLMDHYSGAQKELIYFFGEQDVDLSMASGRVNVFPYGDFLQASICEPVAQRILSFVPAIHKGEYVYWSKGMEKSGLEKRLYGRLNAAFVLKKVDEKSGVVVYQIVARKKSSV